MSINYHRRPDPGSFTHPQDGEAEARRYEDNTRLGKRTRDTGKQALLGAALQNDAVDSVQAKFEQYGMPLHDAQFADVADEVLPWARSVADRRDYDEVLGIDPGDYVTQKNWRRGVGLGLIEKNFSPRARAQGRVAAAATVFSAAMPSIAGQAYVAKIKY